MKIFANRVAPLLEAYCSLQKVIARFSRGYVFGQLRFFSHLVQVESIDVWFGPGAVFISIIVDFTDRLVWGVLVGFR